MKIASENQSTLGTPLPPNVELEIVRLARLFDERMSQKSI
jgi:hypothetical protein